MTAADQPMTLRQWGALLFLGAIWSTSFLAIAFAVKEVPPPSLVLVRVGLGGAALWLVMQITGEKLPRDLAIWRQFLVMGLFNNVIPQVLITTAEQSISSGYAAILNATTPMFAVVLAQVLSTGEQLTFGRVFGVIAGIIGVAVLMGPDSLQAPMGEWGAVIASFGACATYAYAGIYGRRLRSHSALTNATCTLLASALFLAPFPLVLDQPWTLSVGLEAWIGLISLALGATALAYIIYFQLLASAGATRLMLVTLISPVGAVILGALVLGEKVGANGLIGFAIIGLGLGLIDGRLKFRLPGR
jgi:drug/metabolite transporter (DMT)-like permease